MLLVDDVLKQSASDQARLQGVLKDPGKLDYGTGNQTNTKPSDCYWDISTLGTNGRFWPLSACQTMAAIRCVKVPCGLPASAPTHRQLNCSDLQALGR